ncbi:hypothetical protein K1719_039309 [Acacia pycnantha]|nr:hypothetical protein K1719_039309 [Acacia pycnantha]
MADNGFKAGFANALQSMMEQKLPGCGIKATPHITSRIKTLKRLWQMAYDMVYGPNTSGFGWDPDTKFVTAEPAVWEEYLKASINEMNSPNNPLPINFSLIPRHFPKKPQSHNTRFLFPQNPPGLQPFAFLIDKTTSTPLCPKPVGEIDCQSQRAREKMTEDRMREMGITMDDVKNYRKYRASLRRCGRRRQSKYTSKNDWYDDYAEAAKWKRDLAAKEAKKQKRAGKRKDSAGHSTKGSKPSDNASDEDEGDQSDDSGQGLSSSKEEEKGDHTDDSGQGSGASKEEKYDSDGADGVRKKLYKKLRKKQRPSVIPEAKADYNQQKLEDYDMREGEKVPPSTTEPEGPHTRAPETEPFPAQPYGDIAAMLGQIVEEKVVPLKTTLADVVGQLAKMETRMTTIALDLDVLRQFIHLYATDFKDFAAFLSSQKQPAGPSNRAANGNQSPNHAPPLSSKSCDPHGGGARQFAHGSPEASQLSCHNSPQPPSAPEEHVPHCKDGEEHPELHDSRAPSPLCSNPSPTSHSEHQDLLPQSMAPEQSHPDEETADPKPSSHNESPTTNATPTDDVPQSPHTDARHEDNVPQANSPTNSDELNLITPLSIVPLPQPINPPPAPLRTIAAPVPTCILIQNRACS